MVIWATLRKCRILSRIVVVFGALDRSFVSVRYNGGVTLRGSSMVAKSERSIVQKNREATPVKTIRARAMSPEVFGIELHRALKTSNTY